jgi:hypothetical protein
MNCKNCGHTIEGNFCSNCGQKSSIERINLKSFSKEFVEGVFQVNRGFFYTLITLFTRPEASIQDYLDGKRKSHFKPIAYVLLLSTLYFLVSKSTNQGTLISSFFVGFSSYNSSQSVELPSALMWFADNYAYTTLLLLPIFSLSSYLLFNAYKKNYLEHIVLNAYITGQQAIIYLVFNLLSVIIHHKSIELIPVLASVGYNFWVYQRFFDKSSLIKNTILTFLTYVCFLLMVSGILILYLI